MYYTLYCFPIMLKGCVFIKINICWVHTFLCGHLAIKLSWQVLQSFRSKTHKDFIQSIDGCVYMQVWRFDYSLVILLLVLLLLDQKKNTLGCFFNQYNLPNLVENILAHIMNIFDLVQLMISVAVGSSWYTIFALIFDQIHLYNWYFVFTYTN